jgi:hypothetical protein
MTGLTTDTKEDVRELTEDETAAVAGGFWFFTPLLLIPAAFLLAAIWDD